jgi:hypothetical protein
MRGNHWTTGLISLAKMVSTDVKTMIEFGSYSGDSALIFSDYFDKIYCVDPWEDNYDLNDAACHALPFSEVEKHFDKNTAHKKNIVKCKCKSENFKINDDSVGFVYIDALHTYEGVYSDILKARELLKTKNKWIGGHDYNDQWIGVKKAVDEFFNKPDYIFEDSSWLVKLK